MPKVHSNKIFISVYYSIYLPPNDWNQVLDKISSRNWTWIFVHIPRYGTRKPLICSMHKSLHGRQCSSEKLIRFKTHKQQVNNRSKDAHNRRTICNWRDLEKFCGNWRSFVFSAETDPRTTITYKENDILVCLEPAILIRVLRFLHFALTVVYIFPV